MRWSTFAARVGSERPLSGLIDSTRNLKGDDAAFLKHTQLSCTDRCGARRFIEAKGKGVYWRPVYTDPIN